MANYSEKSKEELLELAKERDVSGRSGMNKDELVKALEASDTDSSDGSDLEEEYREYAEEHKDEDRPGVGYQSEASDPENPVVADALEDKPEYEDLSEHDRELADLALDASGPLNVESPYGRIMTGAVDEEQAKEQEKVRAKLPDEFVGDLTEQVSDEDAEKVRKAFNGELDESDEEQEPSLDEQFKARREKLGRLLKRSNDNRSAAAHDVEERTIQETQGEEKERVGQGRVWAQRAQLDTTGLGGPAADRIDKAYRTADLSAGQFQSTFSAEDPRGKEVADAEKERQELAGDNER